MNIKSCRRFAAVPSFATVLAAAAALCWATPEATAGLVTLEAVETSQTHGFAFTNNTLSPQPRVAAGVSTDREHPDGGSAHATIIYYFGVDGPSSVQVPLQIESDVQYDIIDPEVTGPEPLRTIFLARGGISIHGNAPGFNGVTINSLDVDYAQGPVIPQLSDDSTNVYNLNVVSGVQYWVTLDVVVVADNFSRPSQETSASAIADPVISFAPGFDSTGFTLVFSPGVGNGAPADVPEPSTLVMSSIVLGMFGGAGLYKRLKKAATAVGQAVPD